MERLYKSMIERAKLSVSIQEAEFSKDYPYMISVQFNQQKVAHPRGRSRQTCRPSCSTRSSSTTPSSSTPPATTPSRAVSSYSSSHPVRRPYSPRPRRERRPPEHPHAGVVLTRPEPLRPATLRDIPPAYPTTAKVRPLLPGSRVDSGALYRLREDGVRREPATACGGDRYAAGGEERALHTPARLRPCHELRLASSGVVTRGHQRATDRQHDPAVHSRSGVV